MNKKMILLGIAACVLTLGCDSETREGKLTLSGSAPVRIVDEGGRTVEFVSGPVKVEFGAGSGNRFTVFRSHRDQQRGSHISIRPRPPLRPLRASFHLCVRGASGRLLMPKRHD